MWLAEKSVTQMLDIHKKTLRRKVKSGEWNVPFSTLGNKYYYNSEALEKMLLENSTTIQYEPEKRKPSRRLQVPNRTQRRAAVRVNESAGS